MARLSAEGAILEWTDASTVTSLRSFAFVREMPSPTSTKPEIDATALEDLATTTFLGKTDFGNLAIQFFMDPVDANQYGSAFSAQLAGTTRWWKMTDPLSVSTNTKKAYHVFQAKISGLTSNRAVNGVITGTMNLRVTGAASFSAEAA